MTRFNGSKKKAGWIILSAVAVFLGLYLLLDVAFTHSHTLAENAIHLMDDWQQIFWKLILSGSLIVAGFCALLFLSLHRFCLQREDETLRRKLEAAEALNRQNQQLQHHQRLHILGTLTSSIAHEFGNLLTPIMGYSMIALDQIPPENEELYDNLLEIYNASRKAKVIISRLSDLSRKNTDNTFHETSPDDLVRKTLDVATPAKPTQVELRLNLNCWEQRIWANEIQLSQLLLNLVLNSFDAMGEQGILEISTSFNDTQIQLTVQDSGCGIPQAIQSQIFEPFFTTKEPGKGTGLGLAIAAQVVEEHCGSISVSSQEGVGTTFTVILPRTLPPTSAL